MYNLPKKNNATSAVHPPVILKISLSRPICSSWKDKHEEISYLFMHAQNIFYKKR